MASEVGLYFGYRDHRSATGDMHGGFYAVAFADKGDVVKYDLKRPGHYVSEIASLCCNHEEIKGKYAIYPLVMKSKVFESERPPGDRRGPWRVLAMEITPERVKAFWGKAVGAELDLVADISAKELERYMKTNELLHKLTNERFGFDPRSGLGIYVRRGEACFRNPVLEPLAGGE